MPTNPIDIDDSIAALVTRALTGLEYGSVEIVVHDGRIAHVERRERVRLPAGGRTPEVRLRHMEHADRARRNAGGPASTDKETCR